MEKIRKLLESDRPIDRLNFSVKIAKLEREVQRLTGFVISKVLELQTIPELVEEASGLREEFSKLKEVKDCLMAENMVVLALAMESSEAKKTTASFVNPLQEVKARLG